MSGVRTRQHEIRDVGTCDQQYETRRHKKDPERRFILHAQTGHTRSQILGGHSEVFIKVNVASCVFGIDRLFENAVGDAFDIGGSLLDSDVALETPANGQPPESTGREWIVT